jgi:hypothetical protein
MSWNPNRAAGCVYGMEWLPTRQVDRPVAGTGGASYSWTVDSTVAEDIDRLWLYSGKEVPNAYDTVDIYDAADLEPVVVETDTYLMSGDGDSSRFIRPTGAIYGTLPPGSLGNGTYSVNQTRMTAAGRDWYELIDDSPFTAGIYQGWWTSTVVAFFDPVPVLNDEFIGLVPWPKEFYPIGSADVLSPFSQWSFVADGLETGLSGRRILGLTVSCVAQRIIDPRARGSEFDQPVRIRPAIYVNGATVWGQAQLMPSQPQTISYTWYNNPVTGLPWTETDLEDFDSTNEILWLMSRPDDPEVIDAVGGAIYRVEAVVTHCEETRSAVARRVDSQQLFGWNQWSVEAISGGPWGKTSGDLFLFNARLDEQQAVDWRPTLSSEGLSVRALGFGTGNANNVTEVQPAFIEGIPRSEGSGTGYAPAVLLQRDDNDLSVDGQPYAALQDFYGFGLVREPGQPILLQVLDIDTEPDRVRFYARAEGDGLPENNLCVYVIDVLGNTIATSTVVTPMMLQAAGAWQLFDLPLTTTGTWSTPDLYVAFLFASGDGTGWQVLSFTDGTNEPGASSGGLFPAFTIGFAATGVTTELIAYGGDPADFRNDGTTSIAVGVAPETPTGLTATYYGFNDSDPLNLNLPLIALQWDGVTEEAECSEVAYYEIQRRSYVADAGFYVDSGWQTIFHAEVDGSEETYTAYDVEAIRGSTAGSGNEYRVRIVSTTGFASDWSETDEVAPPVDDYCGYLFASNVFPLRNIWLMDVGERSYQMLERVTYYEFEDRDGALPVRGLSDRLDEFEVQLLVGADGARNNLPDIADFGTRGRLRFGNLSTFAGNKRLPAATQDQLGLRDPLRLPYLAVLDNRGNRWFASVETPTGVEQEPGGRHSYRAQVREITRQPEVVTLVASPDDATVLVSQFVYDLLTVDPEPPVPPLPPGPYPGS